MCHFLGKTRACTRRQYASLDSKLHESKSCVLCDIQSVHTQLACSRVSGHTKCMNLQANVFHY